MKYIIKEMYNQILLQEVQITARHETAISIWCQVHPDPATLLRKRVQDEFLATSTGEYKVTKSSTRKFPFGEHRCRYDRFRRENLFEILYSDSRDGDWSMI